MLLRQHLPLTRRGALAALASAPWTAQASSRAVGWNDLVPPGWDPMAGFAELKGDLDQLQDTDPRAKEMMARLRAVWDQAPVVEGLDGQLIRLPGYVVPLEIVRQGLREFLLVPYFGACIHSPPPPSNQIVMCRSEKPVGGLRSMEAVWASGRLDVSRAPSEMGVAGYSLALTHVERQKG